MIGAKFFRIRLNKVDGVYDGTRCLVLFGSEKNDAVYVRIIYLISQKVVLHMQEAKFIYMIFDFA